MSRRKINYGKNVTLDFLYSSKLIYKFINLLMLDGKKTVAENILYRSLYLLESKLKEDKVLLLDKAISNVKPIVEVKTRRVGGTTYQIPVEVRPDRGITLAIRWIIISSRKRSGYGMSNKLYGELLDAYNKRGLSVKKRDEIHRIADSNKAFAHYRW